MRHYYYNTVNCTEENESAQEWMGRLCIKAAECNYKEHDRWLKQQFINALHNEEIMKEKLKQLTYQRNMSEINSEQTRC